MSRTVFALSAAVVALAVVALLVWHGGAGGGKGDGVGLRDPDKTTVARSALPEHRSAREPIADVPARAEVAPVASGLHGRLQGNGEFADVEVVARSEQDPGTARARVRAARDGRFALAGLPAGRFTLAFAGLGVPRGFVVDDVRYDGDGDFDLGTIEVPPPIKVHGRVVDETGAPLSGVRVYHAVGAWSSVRFRLDVVDPAAPEADPNVLTDAAGSFTFADLAPADHVLRAERDGWTPREESFELDVGSDLVLGDLALARGQLARGLVVTTAGAPIVGARVTPTHGPARRVTVRTDAQGAFAVPDRGWGPELLFEADGFMTRSIPYDDATTVRLEPALDLRGMVVGHGAAQAEVRLQLRDSPNTAAWLAQQLGGAANTPAWLAQRLGPHRVAADGTFHVQDLAAGEYDLVATTTVGRSLPVRARVPEAGPVTLRIEPDRAVTVQVRDERGAPVRDATFGWIAVPPQFLEYWADARQRAQGVAAQNGVTCTPVGASGSVHASVPAKGALVVFATARDHAPDAHLLEHEVPVDLSFTLRRCSLIAGRVDGMPVPCPIKLSLVTTGAQDLWTRVDESGAFRSPPLLPGVYRVRLQASDATQLQDHVPSWRVPLLFSWDRHEPSLTVEVRAGEAATASLAMPRLGSLHGIVLARNRPVAGAHVFAVMPSRDRDSGTYVGSGDVQSAHEYHPHTRTDADGRFRFLVASPGTWLLHARHPRGVVASEALRIDVADLHAHREVVLTLPAGEVRGRFDNGVVPVRDRERFVAHLVPLAGSDRDPFQHGYHDAGLAAGVLQEPVGRTGALRFPHVPAGRWVLRFVNRMERIVLQKIVDVPEDATIELGELHLPATVNASIRCGLDRSHAFWLRMLDPGLPSGVFLRTLGLQDGRIDLEAIQPGRYLLQAFVIGADFAGSWGITGKPLGEPVAIHVRDDGSVEPAVVFDK